MKTTGRVIALEPHIDSAYVMRMKTGTETLRVCGLSLREQMNLSAEMCREGLTYTLRDSLAHENFYIDFTRVGETHVCATGQRVVDGSYNASLGGDSANVKLLG